MTANAIICLPRAPVTIRCMTFFSLMCNLQLLKWTVIYFNKAADIARGGVDNVWREDPAVVQIRVIDSALSSTGQSGSLRRQHKDNRRTQLASWPPALIIIPIRKKLSGCSSGYIMPFPSGLCPQVKLGWGALGFSEAAYSEGDIWAGFSNGLRHFYGLFQSFWKSDYLLPASKSGAEGQNFLRV